MGTIKQITNTTFTQRIKLNVQGLLHNMSNSFILFFFFVVENLGLFRPNLVWALGLCKSNIFWFCYTLSLNLVLTVSNTVYLTMLPLAGLQRLHPQLNISLDSEQLCLPNGHWVVSSLGLGQGEVLNLQFPWD